MNINPILKEYLNTPITKEKLNTYQFEWVYNNLPTINLIPQLTTLLYISDINPLVGMSYIPSKFAYKLNDITLGELNIPSNIERIDVKSFENSSVTSLNIDKLNFIHLSAFENCTELETVNINSVDTIHIAAFRNCTNLTKVSINDIGHIRGSAFQGCTNLKEFNLGKLKNITVDNIFFNCPNLTFINYKGTMEEWNSISKSSIWNRGSSLEYIHCIDGDVEL